MKKIKFGLAAKFSLIIFLPVFTLSLLISQNFIRSSLKQIKMTIMEQGKTTIKGIAYGCEYGLLVENKELLKEVIEKYRNEKDIAYIYVRNSSGEKLASYGDAFGSPSDEKVEELSISNDEIEPVVIETEYVFNLICPVLSVRDSQIKEEIGLLELNRDSSSQEVRIGTVQMGLSKANMIASIYRAKIDAVIFIIGNMIAIIILAIILSSLMTKPIKHLAMAADRVSNGDFDHPVDIKSRDEIGIFVQSFNKMMEELKKSRKELRHRLGTEKALADISKSFINLPQDEIDNNINNALKEIEKASNVDATFIFLLNEDCTKVGKCYEWFTEVIKPTGFGEKLKEASVEDLLWWVEKFRQADSIVISQVNELPWESGFIKGFLQLHQVKSFAVVPMFYREKWIGVLGCSVIQNERTWVEEDITFLKMASEIIINALQRKRFEKALANEQEKLQIQLTTTEQLALELQKKTDELTQSNKEMDSFIYTVSHDLKSPLVSIQGFSSMLMDDYKDKLDSMGMMYLERMQKNSERMGMLIDNLLELSRVGRIKGKEEKIDISQMVSQIAEELSPQFNARGTKLIVKDKMPIIMGDSTRISQIFSNLISNANKFMGDDNKEPKIEVGYKTDNGFHKFYVKDNGIGISKEYHEKIFQIFQRLEDIKVEGTGIGLSIVKKIVNSLGGNIWIDSEKGKGATMYFTIPNTGGVGDREEIDESNRHSVS